MVRVRQWADIRQGAKRCLFSGASRGGFQNVAMVMVGVPGGVVVLSVV